MKKILSGRNYLFIYLLIILVFNLFLLTVPLAKVFGFEFSALNALLLVLISGLYTLKVLKKNESKEPDQKFGRKILSAFLLMLLLPFAVSVTHSVFTISCSFKDGLLFYTVLVLPAPVIGLSLALFSRLIFKKFSAVFFAVIFLLILVIPLLEFYFNPQVYFFNPIFGYYPGTIYDEGLSVGWKLVGYRLLNLFYFGFSAFLFYLYMFKSFKVKKIILCCGFIAAGLIFLLFSPSLGYSTTFGRLDSALSKKIVTPHFIIHLPPDADKKLTEAIVLYHEYDYAELKKFFGYDFGSRINSYLFRNDEQKKNLFGSANADVAKPWLHSVFLSYKDYDDILKHELAHCYSSRFGTGLFKVAAGLNPSMIEGIAVAADPVYGDNTIDYMAALAFNNGYKVNLKNLFTGFNFFGQTSSLSYIYSGSFTKYLIKRFGIRKYEAYYPSGNFTKAFGTKIDTVLHDYYAFLSAKNTKGEKDKADYYFGRKSIFYKVCPRFVADRLQTAWSEYYRGNYAAAAGMFKNILGTTDNYSAITGYAECLLKSGRGDEAEKFMLKFLPSFVNTAYYYNLEFKLADIYSLDSEFNKADSLYGVLIKQNPNHTLNYLAKLRTDLISKDSLIIPYLNGNDFDKYSILISLNSDTLHYSSVPVIINLADAFQADYGIVTRNFRKYFNVNSFYAGFAAYKLSKYMAANMDLEGAERTAEKSLLFPEDENLKEIMTANAARIKWFNSNAAVYLKNFKN